MEAIRSHLSSPRLTANLIALAGPILPPYPQLPLATVAAAAADRWVLAVLQYPAARRVASHPGPGLASEAE